MKNKTSLIIYAVIATGFCLMSFTNFFDTFHLENFFSHLGALIGLSIAALVLITMDKSIIEELVKHIED